MPNSSKPKIAIYAFVEWAGEAIVGLVPLIAFKIINLFSSPLAKIYYCPPTTVGLDIHMCVLSEESASQEVCILTVVISGLALWSMFNQKDLQISTASRISVIFCILALLSGALLYALFAEHIARNADGFSYVILIVALAGSLSLHIERAISDTDDGVAIPEVPT